MLGAAGLVRRPDSTVGGLFEFKGSGGWPGNGVHFQHIQKWLTEAGVAAAMDCCPGEDGPAGRGFGAVGMAAAGEAYSADVVELALVAGCDRGLMIGAWLPGHFFNQAPKGTVSAQVWSVGLKLAGAYVLAVGSWVLLLGWWATLFGRLKSAPPEEYELVGAPVTAGPPKRSRGATVEIPPADQELE